MSQLPAPFPVDNWNLTADNYPTVFVIDKDWAQDPEIIHESRSKITAPLEGVTPLDTTEPTEHHGEKTLHVIRHLAKDLPVKKITVVSMDRLNEAGNFIQFPSNLPEALMSIQPLMKKGDLVVINLGSDDGHDSFAADQLISELLEYITGRLGGIAVISAGNLTKSLDSTLTFDAIVVGAVNTNGVASSRFGSSVTCYGVVPYPLPDLKGYPNPVIFNHSSAATAYIAGLVLMMLNYARAQGMQLISKQVVALLKANSSVFDILSNTGKIVAIGNLADLPKIRRGIDVLVHPNP